MPEFRKMYQEFLKIEEELKLFEREIDGIKFWERVRASFILGAYRLAVGTRMGGGVVLPKINRIKFILSSLLKFHRNPLSARSHDILFICSSRRVLKNDGRWWDIYTDDIIDALDLSVAAIEDNIELSHLKPAKTEGLQDWDFIDSFLYIAEKLRWNLVSLNREERVLLRRIRTEIRNRIGFDIDVEKITLQILNYRRIRLPYYRLVLRRIKPKAIVFITSYGKEDLIECSKSLGIPTIELQHGAIDPYHPGYSFPSSMRNKSTFPDLLLTFGDFWTDSIEYPVDKKRVLSVGYPYLETEREKYANTQKKKQILLLSQPTVGEELSKFAVELSEAENNEYRVVYKLHPLEYLDWRKKYPWLVGANLDVIDSSRTPLYQLFAESEIQVGVYSTAIYEGFAFELKTFVFNAAGAEIMDSLVDAGFAIRISSVEEITSLLQKGSISAPLEIEKFFRKDSRDRIVRLLSKIVSTRINNQ